MRGDNPFKIQEGSVQDRKLSGFNATRASGDNLLFMPDFSGWLGKNLKNKQLLYFYIFVALVFGTLFIRIVYLEVIRGSDFFALAEKNRIKTVRLKAPRGILYDRYQRPLLKNVSTFSAYVNPQLLQNEQQANALEAYLQGIFPDQAERLHPIFANFRRQGQEQLIADNIPYDTAMRLLIESSENAALQVSFVPQRDYLVDEGLAPTLGYVGSITADELAHNPSYQYNDVIGKSGIEKQYESVLRGNDGFQKFEVDALGREKDELALTPPQKGADVGLTIDTDIQSKLYEVLTNVSKLNNGIPAAGIVMAPNTGEILGMASVPSYDPAIFTGKVAPDAYAHLLEDPKKPLFARAIAGMYPAGSVFKLAIASAALEEKVINDTFTVNSTGGIHVGGHFFPDWLPGGHGITNIYKAISDSVNTFFYIVGGGSDTTPGLGVDLIDKYAKLFGFGAPTGVDLPGEASGFVPSRAWKEQQGEKWYQGDTYNLSIGQGALTVTPLQIAHYTSFFASGGTFTTPHVLREYRVGDKEIPYQDTKVYPKFVSADTIRIVRQGMRRTVTDGTAKSMQSVHVPVAGKTGTAQFNANKDPHSWFTGFAPFDAPQIVITVLVEQGGERGLAVTAARQFLEWYFNQRT